MPFADIHEQEGAKRLLQSALRSGHVPGAFLFHGPWGVGKTRTALVFARASNCETRGDDACDACPSCRRALGFTHRDIQFIFPTPGGKPDEVDGIVAEAQAAYAKDPFHVLEFDRFASISIDRLREMKRLAHLGVAEGRRKVFVLREADRMLEVQQNALLKILEEPPPATHFVLTTSRPQALLPTVVSRCLRVAFMPLSRETIARVLGAARGLDRPAAALGAAMADGSLGAALSAAAADPGGVRGVRDRAVALLEAARKGGRPLFEAAAALAAEKDRNGFKALAHALALWYGDVLRVQARAAAPERLANGDRMEALRAEARALDLDEIRRRVELCEALVEGVDANANLGLAAHWFLVSLRDPEAARLDLVLSRR